MLFFLTAGAICAPAAAVALADPLKRLAEADEIAGRAGSTAALLNESGEFREPFRAALERAFRSRYSADSFRAVSNRLAAIASRGDQFEEHLFRPRTTRFDGAVGPLSFGAASRALISIYAAAFMQDCLSGCDANPANISDARIMAFAIRGAELSVAVLEGSMIGAIAVFPVKIRGKIYASVEALDGGMSPFRVENLGVFDAWAAHAMPLMAAAGWNGLIVGSSIASGRTSVDVTRLSRAFASAVPIAGAQEVEPVDADFEASFAPGTARTATSSVATRYYLAENPRLTLHEVTARGAGEIWRLGDPNAAVRDLDAPAYYKREIAAGGFRRARAFTRAARLMPEDGDVQFMLATAGGFSRRDSRVLSEIEALGGTIAVAGVAMFLDPHANRSSQNFRATIGAIDSVYGDGWFLREQAVVMASAPYIRFALSNDRLSAFETNAYLREISGSSPWLARERAKLTAKALALAARIGYPRDFLDALFTTEFKYRESYSLMDKAPLLGELRRSVAGVFGRVPDAERERYAGELAMRAAQAAGAQGYAVVVEELRDSLVARSELEAVLRVARVFHAGEANGSVAKLAEKYFSRARFASRADALGAIDKLLASGATKQFLINLAERRFGGAAPTCSGFGDDGPAWGPGRR